MQKKELKYKDVELYRWDEIYIASIENLANEKCPMIPLKNPSGDNEKDNEDFIMTIRSISENNGFIKGYEHAISVVKELLNNSINDYEKKVIEDVFYKLIEC